MKIFLILLISISIYANIKQDMFTMYQNNKYKEVCQMGFKNFMQNNRDEEYISLYAFACLESDYIDRLSTPIAMLKFSKEARANSAYFAIILMQKKLLYHSLVDGYDLSQLNLPTTEHVLSKVFDLYVKLGKHEKRTFYVFEDEKNSKITYKLYLTQGRKVYKMILEEYYESKLVKQHIYW